MSLMKIIINAFQYAPGITGTDRMAHSFLSQLQQLDQSNQYIVICSNESYNRSAVTSSNSRIIAPLQLPAGRFVQRVYNKAWRTILPLRLKLQNADLFFSFHNMNLPRIRVARRMIAFNLDLIPVVLPGYESIHKKSKSELLEEYKAIAKRADHFISISQFSKNELCSLLNVMPERVSVIPLAVNESFNNESSPLRKDLTRKKYLLTIGGTEPRKNVATIVKAFQKLPEKLQAEFPLVIMGGEWHGISLQSFKSVPNVQCMGYVPEAELSSLYENSTAFIFASEYEGFGFTILEAMASNVPVLSSASSSLSEVAGDAALQFEPHDTKALTSHLERILTDSRLRNDLIKRGQKRAGAFSWEASTKQLLDVINDNPLPDAS